MKTYTLLFLSIFCLSCHKEVTPQQLTLDATVIALTSMDCQVPLIDFGPRTTDVAQLIGSGLTYYYAVRLDKQFVPGDHLSVTIRKPNSDETLFCTSRGPGYSGVTIVNATKK